MEPWFSRFKAEGTVDYSQLTFDPGQNELIVEHEFEKSPVQTEPGGPDTDPEALAGKQQPNMAARPSLLLIWS
ncbi:hypothetical protein WMY93_030716 [Mugilogobius chulae]|uniref:Uncharacterized protein n=1 Tax=Mugilogobius chulae TaxID=88201 RepID=A0AAW0MSB8_9GOBI